MFCRTTNENEMGRFAKLLLRLPGENILIHHFCLTSWKSWDCNLRRSYGSAAQLSILKIPLCWTKLNQTLTQNSLPSFLLPNTVSHPENPLVTSFSLQPSAPLVSDVWNISSSFALSARSPSLPTLWYHAATRSIFSCICTFFLKSCIFQGNTSAIDSHLFDLLEAGQDWTEICDKSDRTKFQPREYCETRKLTLFSKFSIT